MREHSGKAKIREATVAGIFYPEEPALLSATIDRLLEAAPRPIRIAASAIISPHAGLSYSGDLSALAWKASLGRQLRRIVILAPEHRAEKVGIYLPESEVFESPLGSMEVDRALVEELRDCGTLFEVNDIPHLEEHGIELQLPFARKLFPEAKIVPIILGRTSPASVKALAAGLSIIIAPRRASSLVVVSTDLEASVNPARAARASDILLRATLDGDWTRLLELLGQGEIGACGVGVLAAYLASSLAEPGVLLGRHDSAASRESTEELLVHYGALAFGGKEEGS